MGIFPFFKPKPFFTEKENEVITEAIRKAEQRTSGEVRVFIESHCKFVEPLERAAEIFYGLKMDQTAEKNAVLVYVAIKDHQLAIYADQGIHAKTGSEFWQEEVKHMIAMFNKEDYAAGIATVVSEIGEALYQHFPYRSDIDKNELPDNIVFGK